MVYKKITEKMKEEVYSSLAFYDEYGFLPKKTKKVTVTLSGRAYAKLKNKKNKSKFVENKILS